MMAAASMANGCFLLMNCLSLGSSHPSASSDSISVATVATTFPMQLRRDIEW